MTRKHFAAIAATIKYLNVTDDVRQHVAEEMASTCASFNGNFDRGRFLAACNVKWMGR
jgi:hypothetical protein